MTEEQIHEKAVEIIDALGLYGFTGPDIAAISKRMVDLMQGGYAVKVFVRKGVQ